MTELASLFFIVPSSSSILQFSSVRVEVSAFSSLHSALMLGERGGRGERPNINHYYFQSLCSVFSLSSLSTPPTLPTFSPIVLLENWESFLIMNIADPALLSESWSLGLGWRRGRSPYSSALFVFKSVYWNPCRRLSSLDYQYWALYCLGIGLAETARENLK